MPDVAVAPDFHLRRSLFVPCTTREHLHDWIQVYLGLDLPDVIVDEDSNSSPLDILWECYSKVRKNDDPDFARVLYYASRDSMKTLSQSIWELLSIFHLRRDCIVLAPLEQHSAKSAGYLRSFLSRPYLRDFVVGNNKRTIEVQRFEHRQTGDNLCLKDWKALAPTDQLNYREHKRYIKIIVASMESCNGEHAGSLVVDEADLITGERIKAYHESRMVPAIFDGLFPLTLITSSRKSAHNLVQTEIDNAPKTGLQIRRWSILDVTERCPKSRHLPHKPKVTIYRSDDLLEAVDEEAYEQISDQKIRLKFVKDEGFAGCLERCKIFAACKGQLATKQTCTSPLLKPIDHVQTLFRTVPLEVAKAQLLCRKPGNEGAIYAFLDYDTHVVGPAEIAAAVTGEEQPQATTLDELLKVLRAEGARFVAGLDFGYTHCFAGALAAIVNNKVVILDAFEVPELDTGQQIELCRARLMPYAPDIYPDTAYPGVIKDFKKRGFRMKTWKKYAGSVVDGIEAVRMKIRPLAGEPELFFLKGQQGCEQLFKRMSAYHWKQDAAGNVTDIPDESDDDLCDAIRYLVMNVFSKGKGLFVAPLEASEPDIVPLPGQTTGQKLYDPKNWMSQLISEYTGTEHVIFENEPAEEDTATKGRSGTFHWDLG